MQSLIITFVALAVSACGGDRPVVAPLSFEEVAERYERAGSAYVEAAPGLRLHYLDQGAAEAPAILLIHGAWSSLDAWDAWAADLVRDHRVVRVDLPGHGLTGPSAVTDIEGVIDALEALRNHLGIAAWTVAGNSAGGHAAWRYALDHRGAVRGLILVNALGSPEGLDTLPMTIFDNLRAKGVVGLGADISSREMIASAAKRVYADPALAADAARTDRIWTYLRIEGAAASLAVLFNGWPPAEDPRAEELASLDTPALILWGLEDRLLAEKGGRWFAETLPDARLIELEAAGHAPMEEAPTATLDAVRTFLAGAGL